MERLMVIPMSEVVLFRLTCPNCGWRFVRSLGELVQWYHLAECVTGKDSEPFCAKCRKKEVKRHDEIRDTVGKLFDLWRSLRWEEIKLSFIASEQREEKTLDNT